MCFLMGLTTGEHSGLNFFPVFLMVIVENEKVIHDRCTLTLERLRLI